MAAPVKTVIATVLAMVLVGTATWAVSDEWAEAREQEFILLRSLVETWPRPADPTALHIPRDEDTKHWMDYVRHQQILRNNLFGDDKLAYLSFTDRFAYTRIDGEAVTGWMPPSRRTIYVIPEKRWFDDSDGYLWIHEFELEGDLLKVEYEFPLRGIWKGEDNRQRYDSEMVLEKEERIRTKYGVEPDVVYRAEIPLKELGKSMDKEFWQSAERVKQR